jgi:hypothetical protein
MAFGGKGKAPVVDGFFAGTHFFIELGVISLPKKKEIISNIENNGGVIDFVISKKVCSHLSITLHHPHSSIPHYPAPPLFLYSSIPLFLYSSIPLFHFLLFPFLLLHTG